MGKFARRSLIPEFLHAQIHHRKWHSSTSWLVNSGQFPGTWIRCGYFVGASNPTKNPLISINKLFQLKFCGVRKHMVLQMHIWKFGCMTLRFWALNCPHIRVSVDCFAYNIFHVRGKVSVHVQYQTVWRFAQRTFYMIGSVRAKFNLAHPHDVSRDAKNPKISFQLGFHFNFRDELGAECKPMEGRPLL